MGLYSLAELDGPIDTSALFLMQQHAYHCPFVVAPRTPGLQSVVLYSLPELDGAIDTVPLGGLAADENIYLVPERVKKLAGRIAKWVALRRKPERERKVRTGGWGAKGAGCCEPHSCKGEGLEAIVGPAESDVGALKARGNCVRRQGSTGTGVWRIAMGQNGPPLWYTAMQPLDRQTCFPPLACPGRRIDVRLPAGGGRHGYGSAAQRAQEPGGGCGGGKWGRERERVVGAGAGVGAGGWGWGGGGVGDG